MSGVHKEGHQQRPGLTRNVASLLQLCSRSVAGSEQLYDRLHWLPSELIEPVLEQAALLHAVHDGTLHVFLGDPSLQRFHVAASAVSDRGILA